jgi:tryptophan-rich sensory protein
MPRWRWRVWKAPEGADRKSALQAWFEQLAANAAWNPLFFGARQPAVALADLSCLMALQFVFIRRARRVDPAAAWLFVPYVLWSAFAAFLNTEVVRRNRS